MGGKKGGARRLEVRMRKSRLIGGVCGHVKQQQEAGAELLPWLIFQTHIFGYNNYFFKMFLQLFETHNYL